MRAFGDGRVLCIHNKMPDNFNTYDFRVDFKLFPHTSASILQHAGLWHSAQAATCWIVRLSALAGRHRFKKNAFGKEQPRLGVASYFGNNVFQSGVR